MITWINEQFPALVAFVNRIVDRGVTVLSNPRQYPLHAMLIAAGVAVLVLLIVVVSMLAVDVVRSTGRRRRLGVKRSYRSSGLKTLLVLAILALAGVLISAIPLVPAAGQLCAGCHSVEPAVASWRMGTHGGASCYSCHADPGFLGAVQASISGVGQLVGERRSVGQVRSAGCVDCHAKEVAETIRVGGLIVRHRDMVEAGMSCVSCHPGVGHEVDETDTVSGAVDEALGQRSRMSACVACHDGHSAPSECETCHESRASDLASEPEKSTEPFMTDTCTGCHANSTTALCVDCHGLELPHSGAFLTSHAHEAVSRPTVCGRCHEGVAEGQACSCHMFGETHGDPSVWIAEHGPSARLSWPGGCMCHDADRCLRCHEANPIPGSSLSGL